MKNIIQMGFFQLLLVFLVPSCSDSSSSSSSGWTEEEYEMFTTQGTNSIGVDPLAYDYGFVVNPSSSGLSFNLSDDADEGVNELSTSELKKCSDHFGEEIVGVQINGNSAHTDMDVGDYIAVKMNGNQSSVNILITNPDAENEETEEAANLEEEGEDLYDVKGICIIASGNKPTANVVINAATVEKVYYMASGNLAAANFEVKEGGEILEFSANISGNAGALTITGDGEYSCDNITDYDSSSTELNASSE